VCIELRLDMPMESSITMGLTMLVDRTHNPPSWRRTTVLTLLGGGEGESREFNDGCNEGGAAMLFGEGRVHPSNEKRTLKLLLFRRVFSLPCTVG
jgi:hypothetical protein